MLFAVLRLPPASPAAEKEAAKQEGKVAGILIDKKDNWLTVKADGEEHIRMRIAQTEFDNPWPWLLR